MTKQDRMSTSVLWRMSTGVPRGGFWNPFLVLFGSRICLLFHCRFSVRHLAVDCVPVYLSGHWELVFEGFWKFGLQVPFIQCLPC
jgi:hypothetical protein